MDNLLNTLTPMTTLQNLPPKLIESIEDFLCGQSAVLIIKDGRIALNDAEENPACTYYLPEPAAIGLLTAWLESEGWEWQKREQWFFIHKGIYMKHGLQVAETFQQIFQKVTKIMEEQE